MENIIFSFAGIPFFASRAFITMLVAIVLGCRQPELFLNFPTWSCNELLVQILCALALFEFLATKFPDLQEPLAKLDYFVKPGVSFFFSQVALQDIDLGVASHSESLTIQYAGLADLSILISLTVAALVWALTVARSSLLDFLIDLDEDDDLGIRRLFSWSEDAWAGFGMTLLIFFPIVALIIGGTAVVAIILLERLLAFRERRAMRPCIYCEERTNPAALACPSCHRPLPEPRQVGLLGQPRNALVQDPDQHRLQLAAKRRCMVCATRLPQRSLQQRCKSCNAEVFPSPEWMSAYLGYVDARLRQTLLICMVFSCFPLIGLLPGIIYYRLSLISSLRTYLPRSTSIWMRWKVRIINLVLISLQWVPLVGAVMLPLLCYFNYRTYRKALARRVDKAISQFEATQKPSPIYS